MRSLVLPLMLLPTAGLAEVPQVVTDVAPVASMAAAVLGDLGAPDLLVPTAADPHHFQLKPSQARALSKADAVFWIGPGLTPWLDKVLTTSAADATVVELAEVPGVTERAPLFGGEEHEDHDAGEDHHAEESGHHHGSHDPHVWLDPANDRAMIGAIAATLARLDPENAGTYDANAEAAIAEIDTAAEEAQKLFDAHPGARLIVFHDAYAHLAAAFGVTIAGTVANGEAADPGAAALSDLRQRIATDGADCILVEQQHPARLAESLAADTGVPVGRLNALGEAGPDGLAETLTGIAAAVDTCLARG